MAHDVHQACAMLDDVAAEPQSMEEQGYGPHGGNVECQLENMECDQTKQANIDDTSNMHGRQDGMGDGPCKGGDIRIPSVFDLSEACCPLYTRARCSKLSATLILMNICTTHGCSNKFLDELLSILHKFILPVDNCLPPTMYHAKSLTRKLGMECNTIHACKMACIFYRSVYVDLRECPKCGSPQTSRPHPNPYKKFMSLSDHTAFDMILPLTGHIQTISMASQEQKHIWFCPTCGGF